MTRFYFIALGTPKMFRNGERLKLICDKYYVKCFQFKRKNIAKPVIVCKKSFIAWL